MEQTNQEKPLFRMACDYFDQTYDSIKLPTGSLVFGLPSRLRCMLASDNKIRLQD